MKFLTDESGIETMPPIAEYRLNNTVGAGLILVKKGDAVLKGQALITSTDGRSVIAFSPTSGMIGEISRSSRKSGTTETLLIVSDGKDTWAEGFNKKTDRDTLTGEEILLRSSRLGIAEFTPLIVSAPGTLIVDCVETEPYLSSGQAVIREYAATILDGAKLVAERFDTRVIFAVGSDAGTAFEALSSLTLPPSIAVRIVAVGHPADHDRLRAATLESDTLPDGRKGVAIIGIDRFFSLIQALFDTVPVIERVVTVSGDAVRSPKNILARVGTPLGMLLDRCGGVDTDTRAIIVGGPLAGKAVDDPFLPLTATCRGIVSLVEPAEYFNDPCIRCGSCIDVCPVDLEPYRYGNFAEKGQYERLVDSGLAHCIECGACAYVCISGRPLLAYIRDAKARLAVF